MRLDHERKRTLNTEAKQAIAAHAAARAPKAADERLDAALRAGSRPPRCWTA